MKRSIWILLTLALMLAVAPTAGAQGVNLLTDPGFEGEQYVVAAYDPIDGTAFSVPVGWGGGVATQPATESWMNKMPTGYPHFANIRWSGNRSLHLQRGFATFTAWVHQQVSVQTGSDLVAGAKAFIENPSNGAVRVGIDPNGGTNPFETDVVWSPYSGNRYAWNSMEVRAQATGPNATIFLFATQSIPADPNGVYWDEAYLIGIPGAGSVTGGGTSQPAPASQYVIANTRLSVRAGAGVGFERIGVIDAGDGYPLLESLTGWYKIDYNGREAYVSSQFSQVSSTAPEGGSGGPTVESLDFTANYTLRMRAAPDSTSAELAIIPWQAIVRAVGRSSDNIWVQVQFEGQTGWVQARYGTFNGSYRGLPVR